jgi:hypothetical protein
LLILNKGGDVSERNRRRRHYWIVGLAAVSFVVILGAGCRKADEAQVKADTALVDTPELVARDPGLADTLGANPDSTRRYLEILRPHWTPNPLGAILECHNQAGEANVRVAISTHERTFRINAKLLVDSALPDSVPGLRGHIVAKVVNNDLVACEEIDLQPHDSVYLWAGKTKKGKSFAIFRIDPNGHARGTSRAYDGIKCKLPPPDPSSSDIHLRLPSTCETNATFKDVLYHQAHVPEMKNLTGPLHNTGVWYACPGGCCQASNFGPY